MLMIDPRLDIFPRNSCLLQNAQHMATTAICHYLGDSSAYIYYIYICKNVNLNDELGLHQQSPPSSTDTRTRIRLAKGCQRFLHEGSPLEHPEPPGKLHHRREFLLCRQRAQTYKGIALHAPAPRSIHTPLRKSTLENRPPNSCLISRINLSCSKGLRWIDNVRVNGSVDDTDCLVKSELELSAINQCLARKSGGDLRNQKQPGSAHCSPNHGTNHLTYFLWQGPTLLQ